MKANESKKDMIGTNGTIEALTTANGGKAFKVDCTDYLKKISTSKKDNIFFVGLKAADLEANEDSLKGTFVSYKLAVATYQDMLFEKQHESKKVSGKALDGALKSALRHIFPAETVDRLIFTDVGKHNLPTAISRQVLTEESRDAIRPLRERLQVIAASLDSGTAKNDKGEIVPLTADEKTTLESEKTELTAQIAELRRVENVTLRMVSDSNFRKSLELKIARVLADKEYMKSASQTRADVYTAVCAKAATTQKWYRKLRSAKKEGVTDEQLETITAGDYAALETLVKSVKDAKIAETMPKTEEEVA